MKKAKTKVVVVGDEQVEEHVVGYFVEAGEPEDLSAKKALDTINMVVAALLGREMGAPSPLTYPTLREAIDGYGDWLLRTRSEDQLRDGIGANMYRLTIERITKATVTTEEEMAFEQIALESFGEGAVE